MSLADETKPTTTPAQQLADLIRASSCTVALTGAGISVPSGIPDFRSPGTGLWTKVDPMEVAHIDAFHRNPRRFWQYYRRRFDTLADKEPNAAHRALAELEARGLLEAVITGVPERSRRMDSCTTCGARYPLAEMEALFDEGVALCAGCEGSVKPDVVLFGELLPESAIAEAQTLCECAELLVCIGSSLEVYPVAGLPELTLGARGRLAIVTQSSTPYDREATVVLRGDVVDELEAVIAALG